MEHEEPTPTFFFLIPILPILRRLRIRRCKRQAALHSALFNYTPLLIVGTDKNKQLTIINPTITAINKILHYKIIGVSKKFKHQPRPLVL
jgi:hypothetical protein